jgi:uncharacterized membrane protein YbhN (UPF0104 family)
MRWFQTFVDATTVFYDHLAAVRWTPLAIALALHFGRTLLRTVAWRNILRASYPDSRVRWGPVLGAYVAGVGVNAIIPARVGDVVKIALVKRRIDGSSYATVAATLVVETLFDLVVAVCLYLWAFNTGALPGLDVLKRLPSIDWYWPLNHPRLTGGVAVVLLLALLVSGLWARRRAIAFWERVAQGFAILHTPWRYLRDVVSWQIGGWVLRLASIFFFLRAFGIPATAHNVALTQVVQSLSTTFPITPGGVGTEQGLLVYIFRGHVPATALISYSVGMKIALTTFNVVVGFAVLALMVRTFSPSRAIERAESWRDPP